MADWACKRREMVVQRGCQHHSAPPLGVVVERGRTPSARGATAGASPAVSVQTILPLHPRRRVRGVCADVALKLDVRVSECDHPLVCGLRGCSPHMELGSGRCRLRLVVGPNRWSPEFQ